MPSSPDRVRDLIRTSGLSQHAFALQIDLDDSKLSKSLSGARRFTSLDLARIAELCNVTVDWIITGADPELAMAARSAGGSAATAIREAKRLSTLRSDMAYLGYIQPWRPVTESPRSRRHVDQGIKLADAALVQVHGDGRSETDPDLAGVIESVFGVDVALADLGADFDGLAVSSDEVKLILVATSQVPARQRFTLAHELGHLLAGDDQELHVDEDVYDSTRKKDASEMRANAFAAAFLMPERLLRSAVGSSGLTEHGFAALSCELGVSPSSLAYRLQSLRLIDAGTCERFRSISGAKAARLAGQGDNFARNVSTSGLPRIAGLLVRDTYAAYESGAATLRPYAALIGADVDTLRDALESEHHVIASA
jgi:Zn-dependent peptidase ImmA (M78 family)/transcriptional regulator with XRE-family HTH domain